MAKPSRADRKASKEIASKLAKSAATSAKAPKAGVNPAMKKGDPAAKAGIGGWKKAPKVKKARLLVAKSKKRMSGG